MLELAHPDDRTRLARELEAFVASRLPARVFEFRKLSREGEVLWVRDSIHRTTDPSGRDILLNVCEDVSERRRHHAALDRLWGSGAPPGR